MAFKNETKGGTTDYGRQSVWRDSDRLDETQAREHAKRLELRARAESEVSARDEYLRLLAVKTGEKVLDVGCGSGAITRSLAEKVKPAGRVVGVDASKALLKVASELAREAGLAEAVEFQEADCRQLPFPDESFDAVVAATTLSHVPRPLSAIDEMIRVTRRGGRIGVFDLDGDLTLFSHPDRELTRKIVSTYSDQAWVNGWLMRELPARLAERNLVDIKVRGFMPLETGGYYANRAERSAETAAKLGFITEPERDDWLDRLRALIRANQFVGGQVHLFVWGKRS